MNASTLPIALDASQVDASLPTPLYHQIYLTLRNSILHGKIGADTVLPGEMDLAQLFNVSRITVKRALNELAKENFVTRHRGLGTVVTPSAKLSVIRGSLETLIESLRLMGDQSNIELLDVAVVIPSSAVAELLELKHKEKVQRAVRKRNIEGSPFSYLISYVPLKLARTYSDDELASMPLLSLLERAGANIDEADQWITAVPADPTVANVLGVELGSPLLKIERLMRDTSGWPVELLHSFYRPDRFIYHINQKTRLKGNKLKMIKKTGVVEGDPALRH